jgi:antitoxin PrlF
MARIGFQQAQCLTHGLQALGQPGIRLKRIEIRIRLIREKQFEGHGSVDFVVGELSLHPRSLLSSNVRLKSTSKENPMTHSTITSKGQTTLPALIRRALRLKAGDRISYELHGDSVVIRPQPGAMAVFGALKPPAGKTGVPFEEARAKSRETWAADTAREGLP